MKVEFTCPKCGSHKLEEIMVNVTVASEVAKITVEDGEVTGVRYDDQTNEDGKVDRYQCLDCGETICTGTFDLDSPGITVVEDDEDTSE